MSKALLIVVATELELKPLRTLKKTQNWQIDFLVSGIGLLVSTWRISQQLSRKKYDLVLQVGVAGSFNLEKYPLASLVVVGRECEAQLGVWEKGMFQNIFQMGLQSPNCQFQPQFLENPYLAHSYLERTLPVVNGISVSSISTNLEHIRYYTEFCKAEIETMEGAALHYVCLMQSVRFGQIRGISNRVGDRDKSRWQLDLALSKLSDFLTQNLAQICAN